MNEFLQYVLIGLTQGASFALLAVGLTLIYGILGVLNFAHGSFAVSGAFLTYGLMIGVGLNFGLAVTVATIAVGALGLVVIRGFLIPLFNRGAPPLAQMLATLGIGVALERLIEMGMGGQPRTIPASLASRSLDIAGATLNQQRLLAGVIAALLVVVVHLVIRQTKLGRQMRAVAQNRVGAQLAGINLNRVYTVTFGLGGALAATAGALVLSAAPITPTAALDLTIKAFIVVIVGGLGNLMGATAMGLALGVVEALAAGYWEPVFAPVVGYVFMIAVLLYRPKGLLAT
jgi:branched-chain amino acid transport system permease protein